jgi:hypothetical protein
MAFAAEPARPARAAGTTLYSIGQPTADEQLYLELLNRTRADALTEALRLANTTNPDILAAYQFFGVDRQKFVDDTAGYPAVQPVSFEARIMEAARGHSAWMLVNGIQAHDQTDPPGSTNIVNTLTDRLKAAGYFPFSAGGESVYTAAENPEHGHAGFEVDWGNGPGGLQNPPGHRISNHNGAFREVGIGVLNGTGPNGTGPQVVTIDFGSRPSLAPLVTGVAYYDLNGNQFYDRGEGIGGLTVNVSDASFHAVTAGSGGYTVPSTAGARTVTFSGGGLTATNIFINLAGENQKVDLRLAYAPPTVNGPAAPAAGNPNTYAFTPVPGGTSYSWEVAQLQAWTGVEGAEGGATNVTFAVTGGYNPISAVKRSGSASFHLAHKAPVASQFFTLNTRVRPKPGAQLTFWKRLGFASDSEMAEAQVSIDGGLSWTSVWSQAGNSQATNSNLIEKTFTQRTVDLSPYVGQNVHVRFGYLLFSGSFFSGDSDNHGLFVDDIAFTATDVLLGATNRAVTAGTSFTFVPPTTGTFLLSVQPRLGDQWFPAGPVLAVNAVAAPPNTAPAFTGLVERSVVEFTPLAFNLTATDSNVPAQPLTFSLVAGPPGLTVAANGSVAWTPAEPDGPRTHLVTVQVSDGQLTDTKSFNVVVQELNQAPVWAEIAAQEVDALATLTLNLSATDADLPPQLLSYSLVSGPTGLLVSEAGQVTWTPDLTQSPATLPVTVRVSDGLAPVEQTFQITVHDAAPVAVVLSAAKLTLELGGQLRLNFSLIAGVPAGFVLERAAALADPTWQPVAAAGLTTNAPGNFSFRFEPSGDAGFYRVRTP